ncbi:helix-turn-helix transcriptional regulator [Victivallis vadensis]|uniref:Helix-turn-helix transcriptional regulator n=1 Tax=Victivallis vadensis TaxID=172901 RepID=A0A848AUG0_9BACT|nr:AraC family transcriptional regulator [Victivallis vadensis]NMD86788.1 helix-turn-helix transcriptional regulator [Victivallis vadensis]
MKQKNEIRFDATARSVFRCAGRLQAGTSVLNTAAAVLRSNIRNDFLNPTYILRGTGQYITATGRKIPYGPGSLMIRMPGVLHHQFHDAGEYVDKYFAIPAPFFQALLEQKLLSPDRPVINAGLHSWLVARFDGLADELAARGERELALSMGSCFGFLTEILLSVTVREPHYAEIRAGASLLEQNLGQRISPAEVAAKVGMTYPNFRRLFTLHLGISPAEYRIRRRIEKIQSLLKSSDLPLKEIAATFGYADIYTFSRQFSRYAGMPPGEFRRR